MHEFINGPRLSLLPLLVAMTAAIVPMLGADLVSAADANRADEILCQIRDHKDGLALWWTGQNGWLMKGQGVLIGTDLVLADQERLGNPPPVSAEQIAPLLDISIVTHGHSDHFHGPTSRILLQKSRCMFVIPASCLDEANQFGIPENRIIVARPRQALDARGIKLDVLRAIHGDKQGTVYYEANLEDCGYLLHLGGKTVMQPGDSVLLEDHLRVKHVNALLFSPTEHNWLIDDSVTAIQTLEPDVILPQHRDTYPATERDAFWAKGYPYEVKSRLPSELRKRYRVVAMGEMVLVQ
jgi:L-ascorbate metabolism protein UlaG (beta-lactamase superfamily)